MAITQITKSIAYSGQYGVLPFVTFRNVNGLGQVITKQMAVEFIPDPSAYAGGPKYPQVQAFGTTAKIASDIKGRNESATASIVVSDPDGSIAAWFEDPVLSNAPGIECSIEFRLTTDRLNSIDPAPDWHGLVKQPKTVAGGKFQFDCWDLIQSLGSQPIQANLVGALCPGAPTTELQRKLPRYYGRWSDEPSDAVTGAPVPAAETGTGCTAAGVSLLSVISPTFSLYGDAPAGVALAGFGSVAGVAGAPGQPSALSVAWGPQSGGSPGNAWGNNLNWEEGFRFQVRALSAGGVPGDPYPFLLDDPLGFSDPGTINVEPTVSWASATGASSYEAASGQLAQIPGTGSDPTSTFLRAEQVLPVSASPAAMNQTPHADEIPIDPLTISGGAIIAPGAASTAALWAYVLTAVTATGETAASLIWLSRPSAWTRPIRGVATPVAGALSYNLYKSTFNTTTGALGGFTQRKFVPPAQLNGSGNLYWEDDLAGTGWSAVAGIGSGGVGGAAVTQGKVPGIDGGPWMTDLLGMPWDRIVLIAEGAITGLLGGAAYSVDSSGVVTPLAPLIDSQISLPGFSGFTSRWGSAPYFTIGGIRVTAAPVTGPLAADLLAGKITIRFNLDGVETVGDATGTTIVSPVDIKAHLEDNDILPIALGLPTWPGGNWATAIPTYGDGRPARNAASYSAAKAFQLTILTADVGALDLTDAKACADLEAFLAVDCECANYPDENGAIALMPEHPNVNANVRTDLPITDVQDIIALSASWQQQTTDDYFFNTLTVTYGGTLDASGTRQNQTTLPLKNTTAIGNMRGRLKACSETLALLSRQDGASAAVIGNRILARAAPAPRDVALQTFLYALGRSGFRVGDLVPVTDLTLRFTQKLLQVRSIGTNWDTYAVALGLRALNSPEALMAAGTLAWFFGGDNNNQVIDTSYPSGTGVWLKGIDLWTIDSANLLPGSFQLQGMGQVPSGVTLKVGLFNLTDAPNTPMVELTFTNTSPLAAPIASSTITFAAPGSPKVYAVKGYVSGGLPGPGFGWGFSIVRTA